MKFHLNHKEKIILKAEQKLQDIIHITKSVKEKTNNFVGSIFDIFKKK